MLEQMPEVMIQRGEHENKQSKDIMYLTNKIKLSVMAVILAFAGFACSSSTDNNESATIEGSVEGNSSQEKVVQPADVYTVTAARVTSNGSFETIEGTETETNASGEFTMSVDAEAAQNIVIIAENEGQEWKGFLQAEVENGQSYIIKPIDAESDAETNVFAEVVASGDADIVHKSDIEAAVSSDIAAEVRSSSSVQSQIAAGLSNASEARAEFFAEMESTTESQLDAALEAMAEAQVQLESELHAASNTEDEEAAYDVYFESTVNAYIEAGLDESTTAKAIDVWTRVYVNSMSSASSEVENDCRENASLMVAIATDLAVQAQAEAAGMSQSSIDAIIDAGVQLRSDIKASAGAESEVEAAFTTYHDEVRTTMENDSSVEATVVITADSEINSSNGAKSTFENAILGIISADLVIDAYTSFFTSVDTTVQQNSNGMGDSKAKAVTELLILINLSS